MKEGYRNQDRMRYGPQQNRNITLKEYTMSVKVIFVVTVIVLLALAVLQVVIIHRAEK